jgi:hypothetical protein
VGCKRTAHSGSDSDSDSDSGSGLGIGVGVGVGDSESGPDVGFLKQVKSAEVAVAVCEEVFRALARG